MCSVQLFECISSEDVFVESVSQSAGLICIVIISLLRVHSAEGKQHGAKDKMLVCVYIACAPWRGEDWRFSCKKGQRGARGES